ncbi:MAG TPA: N-acetyltransferase family protein [Kaistella chaponensis]|jgi:L-amino acid N-acyltransferase YncA|uniref:Phosphinothricin acetyltransferase n=1 Tax=Kaistella chaponensis TaxID=713588 RepID=A0A1N7NSA4_9FLAO|nr:GNAT family N-acetyltransferase [Kaistella chaponensis]SIT01255.1 phosphinothricin acetyltransferase [Kaistella chaponensis]HPW88186.1 N-acetyltransferase family protein [Kaistella chaponensis]HQC06418.1 N-acetyltransferase family protein [Kaistella chaponensis]
MNYQIRPMQPEDGEKVIEIFEEGIAGGNATFDQSAPSWEVWDQKFFNVCRFVLETEDHEILGWAALQPVSNRDCFKGVAEISIYMKNAAQGKGFGSMLLKKLVLDSEEHQFWTLQSGIFPENEPSIIIHKKLGFREVGRREKLGQMNGVWRDIILLERRSKIVGISAN